MSGSHLTLRLPGYPHYLPSKILPGPLDEHARATAMIPTIAADQLMTSRRSSSELGRSELASFFDFVVTGW